MFTKWLVIIACVLLVKISGLEKKIIKDDNVQSIELSGEWKFNTSDGNFADLNFDDKSWVSIIVPEAWENAGYPGYDGVAWYRYEFKIPKKWKNKKLSLSLGKIDDADITYFNGEKIGETKGWDKYRTYNIPAGLIKPGENNALAIKVTDSGGNGGLYEGEVKIYNTGKVNFDVTKK